MVPALLFFFLILRLFLSFPFSPLLSYQVTQRTSVGDGYLLAYTCFVSSSSSSFL
jgi:hypothetical protein